MDCADGGQVKAVKESVEEVDTAVLRDGSDAELGNTVIRNDPMDRHAMWAYFSRVNVYNIVPSVSLAGYTCRIVTLEPDQVAPEGWGGTHFIIQ